MDKSDLINELKANHLWLKKSYGQHFLVDPQYLDIIIDSAKVKSNSTIIEVGPGLGVLTKELSLKVKEGLVLAIEADFKFAEVLRAQVGQKKNVKIVHQNALIFDWESIDGPYQVVANLPYNIASPLLYNWLIKTEHPPIRITVMLQKEVAQRLSAKPGTKARGLPTIMAELVGKSGIITDVPADAFFPPPKVTSAILDIQIFPKKGDELAILKIAKAGFSNKRRTLENSLSGSLHQSKNVINELLKSAKINPQARGEELTIEQWRALTKEITHKFSINNPEL